ncbi:MAG: cytochrome c-type biogenesis protein CcmH [Terriglobales bacterium]
MPQRDARPSRASRANPWPRLLVLAAITLAASAGLRGDGQFSPRAQRIGSQLICTCGCRQGALVCTTPQCSVKLQMQAEIRQRAQSTDSDSLVLQSFVQEYGSEVLANPTHQGFNETAWVVPWVALGVGLLLVLMFVRRFRRRPRPQPVSEPELEASVRAELAAELEREE